MNAYIFLIILSTIFLCMRSFSMETELPERQAIELKLKIKDQTADSNPYLYPNSQSTSELKTNKQCSCPPSSSSQSTSISTSSSQSASRSSTSSQSTSMPLTSTQSTSMPSTSTQSIISSSTSIQSTSTILTSTKSISPLTSTQSTSSSTSTQSKSMPLTSAKSTSTPLTSSQSTLMQSTSTQSTSTPLTSTQSTSSSSTSTQSTSMPLTSAKSTSTPLTSTQSTSTPMISTQSTSMPSTSTQSTISSSTSIQSTSTLLTSTKSTSTPLASTQSTSSSSTSTQFTSTPLTSIKSTSTPLTRTQSTSMPSTSTQSTSMPSTSTQSTSTPLTSTQSISMPSTSTQSTTTPLTSTQSTSMPMISTQSTSMPSTSTQSTISSSTSIQSTSTVLTSTKSTSTPLASTQSTSSSSTSIQSTTTPLTSTQSTSMPMISTQSTSMPSTSTQSTISSSTSIQSTSTVLTSIKSTSTPLTRTQSTSMPSTSTQSTSMPSTSTQSASTVLTSTKSTSMASTSKQLTSATLTNSQSTSAFTISEQCYCPPSTSTPSTTISSTITQSRSTLLTNTKSASTLLINMQSTTSMPSTSSQSTLNLHSSTHTKLMTTIIASDSSYPTRTTANDQETTTIQIDTTTENSISNILIHLANETITNSSDVYDILVILNNTLTAANGSLRVNDLKCVSEILCHCSVIPDLEDQVFFLYMDCYNQVLDQQTLPLREAQYRYNTSLLYLECVHQMATNMVNSSLNYNNENVAMSIIDTNCGHIVDQYDFGLSIVQHSNYSVEILNDTGLDSAESMSTVFAFLPYSVLCLGSVFNGPLTRNDFLIYRNQKLFSSSPFIDSTSNGTEHRCQVEQVPQTDYVVTVKVLNSTTNYTNLVQPVSYGFRQNKFNGSLHAESICAYWVLEWHTNYCTLQKSQGNLYLCECSHLTDFSLLVDNSENDPALCDNTLSTLGLILIILSIISLFTTIILKMLGNLSVCSRIRIVERIFNHSKIKSVIGDTLLVALFLFYILFSILSDGETLDLSNHSCAIAGAVLYTVLMTTLFFAAFTGLIFFKVYYIVFNHRCLSFCTSKVFIIAISLGIPATLTIILWYSVEDFFWRNDRFCWIRPSYVSLTVVLPNMVLLLGDIVLSGFLIKGFFFSGSQVIQSARGRKKIICKKIVILLTVQLVMGLPWVFEYFTLGTPRVTVFSYLFTIANGSQGIWLTLIYLYSLRSSIKSQKLKEQIRKGIYHDNSKGRNTKVVDLTDVLGQREDDIPHSADRGQLSKKRLTRYYSNF